MEEASYSSLPETRTAGYSPTDPSTGEQIKKREAGELPDYNAKCNDWPFSILFVINVVAILALAGVYGSQVNWDGNVNNLGDDVLFAVVIIIAGILFAYVWIQLLKKFASSIITCNLIGNIFLWVLFGLVFFVAGNVGGGIISLLFAVFSFMYYRAAKPRIPFATATLEIAVAVVTEYPMTVTIALIAVVFQALWIVVWVIAAFGYADDVGENGDAVLILFLLSLYWTLEVLKFTVHSTTAGVTAAWYYTPGAANPTWGSFKRSTTSGFGSICFGSLLISIINVLIQLANMAMNQANTDNIGVVIMICIARCLLSCLQSLAEIFSEFAFVYTAIHGWSFCHSGKAVYELFVARGWQLLINESLAQGALQSGAMISGLIIGGAAAGIGYAITQDDNWILYGVMGLILGFYMTYIVLHVLISAIETVYVVWVDDPNIMYQTRPEEGKKLSDATDKLRQYYSLNMNDNRSQNSNYSPTPLEQNPSDRRTGQA